MNKRCTSYEVPSPFLPCTPVRLKSTTVINGSTHICREDNGTYRLLSRKSRYAGSSPGAGDHFELQHVMVRVSVAEDTQASFSGLTVSTVHCPVANQSLEVVADFSLCLRGDCLLFIVYYLKIANRHNPMTGEVTCVKRHLST